VLDEKTDLTPGVRNLSSIRAGARKRPSSRPWASSPPNPVTPSWRPSPGPSGDTRAAASGLMC
jgi:hypothetical protein